MALITDPDLLNQGTEVTINTGAKTITLSTAGNLSNDGVTLQALYSFLKEEWRTDATLIPFDFPLVSITPEQFEWVEDWVPVNDTTRNLIRSAGWREITAANAVKREYLGVISLGNIESASQPYYAFSSDTSATNFAFTGPVNQGVQTFGDATNGNFDKRTDVLTLYIRTQGNTYGSATSVSIGVSSGDTLSYIARRFPLSEATDLNISASDVTIAGSAPYTGMSITYYATPQASNTLYVGDLSGGPYNFGIVIDGNNGTSQEIYEFVQWSLRQTSDIDADADTKTGQLQDSLLQFVGSTLETLNATNPDGGGTGTAIINFDANDTNSLIFRDNTEANRTFPFVAAGSITFNANLSGDTDAIYRMFFTTNPGGNFGSASAILVDNAAGTDISGNIAGATSVAFDFDYDGNVQGGRTAGTDADITIVAIGLSGAQYVVAEGTITRATGQNFSLVAPLERNYANP